MSAMAVLTTSFHSNTRFVMRPLNLLLLIVGFLVLTVPSHAQTGTITGHVMDAISKEPLPAANIQLVSTNVGASSDVDGHFEIRSVPVGSYQMRVSLVGYAPRVISDVVVAVGKPLDIIIRLEENTIGLDVVEVQGSYFQKNTDAPVSVQRLSYEEIRRSPGGFEDVVRAISVFPGVAQAEPGRNDLVVRGGAPSENLYVVDNIEVPNINHFGTQGSGGGPLSYINLDYVSETSFSTGGFGVRYGDKLSSVLTIDFRDGREDRLGGKATISATMFGLNLEGPIDQNGSFVFSARRSYLDLIFRVARFSFVPEYWDVLGRANYALDKANTLTFLFLGALDRVNFFNRTPDDRFSNSRILGTDQNQYVSGLTWQHLFGAGYLNVTLGRTYVTYNGVQRDSLLNPIFTNVSNEGETSLRGDVAVKLSDGVSELSFGSKVSRVKFATDLVLPAFDTSFGDTLRVNVTDLSTVGYKGSVYAQYARDFSIRWKATLGARADYFSLTEKKFVAAPRASLRYQLTDATSVTATAGTYYQNPSYVWLVANEANRSLKPTRADQYILSIEHMVRDDFKVRVETFLKEYRDYPASLSRLYLVLANTGGGYGGSDDNFASFGIDQLANGGTGRSYGVEFLAQKKLSEIPLYGLVSLTLGKALFTALDGVARPGSFDQEVIFNISVGYKFNESWEASAKFRFATGRPYTPFNPDGTQDAERYNAERVPASHSLDLRVDRRWNFSTWNLIAYVDLQNVYNNKIAGSARWNARTQQVEITENAIGFLPSIGVSAEW